MGTNVKAWADSFRKLTDSDLSQSCRSLDSSF
jgi:hypothetical protein